MCSIISSTFACRSLFYFLLAEAAALTSRWPRLQQEIEQGVETLFVCLLFGIFHWKSEQDYNRASASARGFIHSEGDLVVKIFHQKTQMSA